MSDKETDSKPQEKPSTNQPRPERETGGPKPGRPPSDPGETSTKGINRGKKPERS